MIPIRRQLVELEDLPGFPPRLRDLATDVLRVAQSRPELVRPLLPLVVRVLERGGTREVLDLASGGGGAWPALRRALAAEGICLRVTLSDRYPSASAAVRTDGAGLRYHPDPVDALAPPPELPGMRTMLNALHHFEPDDVVRLLRSVVAAGRPLLVAEYSERSWRGVAQVLVAAPISAWAAPARLRAAEWDRLLLTYLLPAVPLVCLWDGVVSQLRAYEPDELLALAAAATRAESAEGAYRWEAARRRVRGLPVRLTHLLGWPERT